MKQLGVFTQDGFKGSIELLKFLREMNNDIAVVLSAIVGTSTVFIKGGVISQSGGSTTITDGIIFKDGKFYYFTGSTTVGTPATLKVLFTTTTAAGYPLPTYVGNPIGADIYLDNTAKIDTTGAIFLNTIGTIYDLQTLKSKIGKNAWIDISPALQTPVDSNYTAAVKTIRLYEDATVQGVCFFTYTTARAIDTTVLTLPNNGLNIDTFNGYWTSGVGRNPVTLFMNTAGTVVLNTALPASGTRTLIFSFNYKLL